MSKKNKIIHVQNIPVSIITGKENDFICLTDMAKGMEGEARAAEIIKNRIRTRTTLEFLGRWKEIYNSNFKEVEFDHFKMQVKQPTCLQTMSSNKPFNLSCEI